MKRFLIVMSVLAAACGGASTPSTSTTTSTTTTPTGGAEPHAMPAELNSFHDVLSPLWHADPGEQRTADTCAAVPSLTSGAASVKTGAAPAGADAAAWTAAADKLGADVVALGTACGGDRAGFEPAFEQLHEAFHALVRLAGAGHDEGEHHQGEGHDGQHGDGAHHGG